MVAERSFVIDATFLLNDAEKAFFGSAPLSDGCSRNTSVTYVAVSDMDIWQVERHMVDY